MDPVAKKIWCEALESGEFHQGRGALKKKNGSDGITRYCCLGVAKEIFPGLKGDSNASLTRDDCDLLGLKWDDVNKLMEMNDGERRYTHGYIPNTSKSFKQIAEYIRRYL
jgi:hypothetical protein